MRPSSFAALAFIVLVLACGPGGGQPSGSSGSDAPAPRYGGVLQVPVNSDIDDMDITLGASLGAGEQGVAEAYNSLLGFKAGPGIDYNELTLRPELAERWEVSSDARRFTFYLRKGVKFADLPPVNGRELTSGDVKWSIEYVSRTGWAQEKKLRSSNIAWMYEGLDRVETTDATTVVVRFTEPFAPFLSYAASDFNAVLAREVYEQDGHLSDRMVGTGPFQLDAGASQKGTRWVFKRHPRYWEQERPYLDELRMLVLTNDAAMMAAFQARQLDVLTGRITTQQAEDLKKALADVPGMEFLAPAPLVLFMNQGKPPLSDFKLRKAVALAVDPDEFVKVVFGGKGGWAMPGAFHEHFSQEEIRQIQRRDLEEAKRLVREAGFPNGIELEFMYNPGQNAAYQTSMELLQAQLRKVGINLALKVAESNSVSGQRRRSGDYQLNSLFSSNDEVDAFLTRFLPGSKTNYIFQNDPKLTELILAQRREGDVAKRRELVRQAARYIYDNAYALTLVRGVDYEFWQPALKAYAPNYGNKAWPLAHSWLER